MTRDEIVALLDKSLKGISTQEEETQIMELFQTNPHFKRLVRGSSEESEECIRDESFNRFWSRAQRISNIE